jgi:RimJ/RimL family protein N-acetyltransferase
MTDQEAMADDAVTLDGFTLEDVDAQLAGEDEEHARRFGWFPDRSTAETVTEAITAWQNDERLGRQRRAFAVRTADRHVLAGGCEIRWRSDGTAEISYWVFPAFRGRGLASRAVRLVIRWADRHLDVLSIRLEIEPDNIDSIRVATAAGFTATSETVDDRGRATLIFERSADANRS